MEDLDKAKRIAISICKKYNGRGITFIEMYKICLDVIDKLIEEHKDNPNFDVNTYKMLSWHLRQAITRRIADKNLELKSDDKYGPEVKEYLDATKKYIIENYKIPKDEDIAKILGKNNEDIRQIKKILYDGKECN